MLFVSCKECVIGEEGLEIRKKGVGNLEFYVPLPFQASGTSPYTKGAAINMEKRSVEYSVNHDSI